LRTGRSPPIANELSTFSSVVAAGARARAERCHVEVREMENEVDRQALLTTLTTEHFTLQGARASTISESSTRSALYLGSLSASLVSLGFVAQISATGDTFKVFALVVLPTLFLLGIFTFVRLVENMIEDLFYGRAINRIRGYYVEHAGTEARYFMLSTHDDALGVLSNMGLTPSRWQL